MAPDVMGKLRDLLNREVDRHDCEWMETMQRLSVTERTEKRPVTFRSRDDERDCRSIVNQLVNSMPKDVLLRTSFTEHQTSTHVQPQKNSGSSRNPALREKYNLRMQGKSMSRARSVHPGTRHFPGSPFVPGQDDLSGETMLGQLRDRMLSVEPNSKRPRDRILSGESRNITDRLEHDDVKSIGSIDDSRHQSLENTSETTSNSDVL